MKALVMIFKIALRMKCLITLFTSGMVYFIVYDTGPARGPEKGGGRKSLDPILKRTKPTRPPKKIKTPQFWATSKWKFKNL